MLVCISHIFQLFYTIVLYLQRVLGANGQNLVLEVAQLTAPGASLTDPADKAGLVCAAHRAGTATRAQQLPLQDTKSRCMRSAEFRVGCLLFFIFQSYFLQHMSVFFPMLSFHTIPLLFSWLFVYWNKPELHSLFAFWLSVDQDGKCFHSCTADTGIFYFWPLRCIFLSQEKEPSDFTRLAQSSPSPFGVIFLEKRSTPNLPHSQK